MNNYPTKEDGYKAQYSDFLMPHGWYVCQRLLTWLAGHCSGEMIRWVATVLHNVDAEYFYHCRKFCWAMVF